MGEEKGKLESIREWVVDHKLRAVGTLSASGIVGCTAYNWSQLNMKTSGIKIIPARRMHAQALALTALAFPAIAEYCDHMIGAKAELVAKFPQVHQQQTYNQDYFCEDP